MSANRIFKSAKFLLPSDAEPLRSVITESIDAVVVAWYLHPGQSIAPHFHPHGQDTWTILSGEGTYYLDEIGTKKSIVVGDVVIAPTGCIHGVFNHANEALIFISVVSPSDAGYQTVDIVNVVK
jgi:quercetin dioxygenase-like cupin family protein